MNMTLSKKAWLESCERLGDLLTHEVTEDYLPRPWPVENAGMISDIDGALEHGRIVRIPRRNRTGTSAILAAAAVFATIRGKAPCVLLLTQRWHQAHRRQEEIVGLFKRLGVPYRRNHRGEFFVRQADGETILIAGPLHCLPSLLGRNGGPACGLLLDRMIVENAIGRSSESVRSCIESKLSLKAPNFRTLWAVFSVPVGTEEDAC